MHEKFLQKNDKIQKVKYYPRYVTESVNIWVNCRDLIYIHAWHCSDITQKPRDHVW